MSVKNLRQKKGWSQEHLAQASGLSLRTIQRIESGKRAGLETLNGLAAVFDIDLNLIKQEPKMTTSEKTSQPGSATEKNQAKEYMDNIKSLKIMFWAYLIFMPLLYALNIWTEPEFLWIWIVAAGWGAGFPLYAIIIKTVFGVFDLGMTAEEAERHFNTPR
ncbi:MAG: helix-turn-helix domain-containing protein [Sphingomonadales bacterium]